MSRVTIVVGAIAVLSAPGSNIQFTDATIRSGLAEFRSVSGGAAKDYIFEATGAGAAFVDFDGDGWLDVYLPNGGTLEALRGQAPFPPAALFRNNREGRFERMPARAGLANERWAQGVCAGDYDNDGRVDLYVTNIGANRLYRNAGDGTFADVAPHAGVAIDQWSTGCAFGDYDRDGWLDLFVAGYVDIDFNRLPPPATGPPAPPQSRAKPEPTRLAAAYVPGAGACHYRGVRVMCGPRGLKGARDFLFRNNGDGTFTDASRRAGVDDARGGYGFGVAWADYDDDGWLDLLVANDSTASYVYRNRGDGTFADESLSSGAALTEDGREQAGMGIAIGDYDRDGRLDVHRTNFADDTNVLYRNEGGAFSETTWRAGLGFVTLPFVGWGTIFSDFDHDGWPDLAVANGHVYPVVDRHEWGTQYRQRLLVFRNTGSRFEEITGEALAVPRLGRGLAAGDYDNDGDLDVLVSSLEGPPALLRNEQGAQSGRWVLLALRGDPAAKSPRDAIGAVVTTIVGGRPLRGEVASGGSFNSQSDLRVHFGVGTAEALTVEVRWPNGDRQRYPVGQLNRTVVIDQRNRSQPPP